MENWLQKQEKLNVIVWVEVHQVVNNQPKWIRIGKMDRKSFVGVRLQWNYITPDWPDLALQRDKVALSQQNMISYF